LTGVLQDVKRGMLYTALAVLDDGEHHNAADATLDFLGNRDRIHSLRLHSHAETEVKANSRNLAASGTGRISPRLLCSRRRKGR